MPVRSVIRKSARRSAKRVTIDDVWATIDEMGKIHKEFEKAQKEAQEAHKEFEKAHKKAQKEVQEAQKRTEKAIERTEKTVENTNKAISGLGSTVGSLVEHIMTPDLPGKFRQFGYSFNKITTIKWAVKGNIYAQIDGLLENGAQAMVVEVKTTLRHEDIDEHVERMDKVRAYSNEHGDHRQFLGAIAAMITDESTRNYALKKGFFVIEPSGEDVKVTKPPSEPKIW